MRDSMTTLLGEDRHELLEWSAGLANREFDLNSVAVDEIRCEWGVMERIKPVPAHASLVVVIQDPLKAFNVRLPDSL